MSACEQTAGDYADSIIEVNVRFSDQVRLKFIESGCKNQITYTIFTR